MSAGTPPPDQPAQPDPASGQGAPPPYPQNPAPPQYDSQYDSQYGSQYGDQPSGYPSTPPPPGYAAGPQPAGLLDRFVARLVDVILIGIVNVIIDAALLVGAFGLRGANAFGTGGTYAAAIVSAIVGVVINLAYFALMDSSQGRTLGKMVMKLHVQGASGGKASIEESLKRNWWLALPLLAIVPVLGGLIGSLAQLVVIIVIAVQINNRPDHRPALSDGFAGTQVIKQG